MKKYLLLLGLVACNPPIKIEPPNDHPETTDSTPPVVTITEPTQAAVLLGTKLRFAGAATDEGGVESVEVQVGAESAFLNAQLSSTAWSFEVDTAGLKETQYFVLVRATDAAGNVGSAFKTITVLAAPVAILTDAPDALTNQTSLSVAVGGTGITQYRASIDGAAFSADTPISTRITATLAEGAHTLDVVGGNSAGIFAPYTSATRIAWTIDATPPVATLAPTPATQTNQTSYLITVGGADVVTYTYSVDGAPASAITPVGTPITETLGEGAHTLAVVGLDAANNVQATATVLSWTIDTTPPTTTLTNAPPVITNSASPNITVNGASAGYRFSLDCAAPFVDIVNSDVTGSSLGAAQTGTIPDGFCTLTVKARDLAGNMDPTGATVTWTVDLSSIDTVLTNLPANPTNQALDISVSSAPSGATAYKFSLDCQPPFADIVNRDVPSIATHINAATIAQTLTEGACTLQVIARNAAGTEDPDPSGSTVTFTFDSVTPSTNTLTGLPPANAATGALDVTVTATDNADHYLYSLDCDDNSFDKSNQSVLIANHINTVLVGGPLPDGNCSLSVRAADAAGNIDASPEVHSWNIDTLAPHVSLSGVPGPTAQNTTFNIAVTSGDGASGYTYTLDCGGSVHDTPMGGTTVASLAAITNGASPVADGPCTLSVFARDLAGNVAPTGATASWTVDTVPADSTLSGVPGATGQNTTFSITVNPLLGAVAYRYTLDCFGTNNDTPPGGTVVANVATPITQATTVSDGSCTLDVFARDLAGNEDLSASSATWTVDTLAPTATLSPAPTGRTNQTSYTFTVGGSGVAEFIYSLDGAAFSSPQSAGSVGPFTITANTSHSFAVRGIDLAGNTQAVATSATWTVDTIGPVVTIASGAPAEGATVASTSFTPINIDSADGDAATYSYGLSGPTGRNGSGVPFATDISNVTNLTDGDYALTVTGVDTTGNSGSAVVRSFTVDAVAPVITCRKNGQAIAPTDDIVIDFDQAIGDGTGGTSGPTVTLSLATPHTETLDNVARTLTLHPTTTWTVDVNQLFAIRAYTKIAGSTTFTALSCAYDVLGGAPNTLYVNADVGPGGNGSLALPFRTITDALNAVPAMSPTKILVAASVAHYTESITLLRDVQIYGGYSAAFTTRISGASRFRPAASMAGTINAPDASVRCDNDSVNAVLDGFTIEAPVATAPAVDAVASVFLDDSCAAVIRNNVLLESLTPTERWYGVRALSASSSVVQANRIQATTTMDQGAGISVTGNNGLRVVGNSVNVVGRYGITTSGLMNAGVTRFENNTITLSAGEDSSAVQASLGAEFANNVISLTAVSGSNIGLAGDDGAIASGNTVTVSGAGALVGIAHVMNPSDNVVSVNGGSTCTGVLQGQGVIDNNQLSVVCSTALGISLGGTVPVSDITNNTVTANTRAFDASGFNPDGALSIAGNSFITTAAGSRAFNIQLSTEQVVSIADNFMTSEAEDAVFSGPNGSVSACATYAIERNRFKATSAKGLTVNNDGCVTIKNNIFLTIGTALTLAGIAGTNASVVEHNTIIAGMGGILHSASAQALIVNNIVQGDALFATAVGIDATANASGIRNNSMYNWLGADYRHSTADAACGGTDLCTALEANAIAGGNITMNAHEDARLRNPYGNDFRPFIIAPAMGVTGNCNVRLGAEDRTATTPSDYTRAPNARTTSTPLSDCTPSNLSTSKVSMGAFEVDDL